MMHVPLNNLRVQHDGLRDELREAIEQVVASSCFSGGTFVEQFEEEFATFCGARFAIGVGSGTEALWFILLALGVGAGDEVITVPSTFIATAEAITYCGARPIFVDIDEETYTMDPRRLESAITKRTRAIVPVHLFGQTADMDAIRAIAARHGLPVVEDACQAHGAEYKGRRAGALGDAACFSFYPGKNLGAMGEAGAVVTNDTNLKGRIEALRNHGRVSTRDHSVVGWNGRMDGIQAAVLSVKLRHLQSWNLKRRAHAQQYTSRLDVLEDILFPATPQDRLHAFHVYAIRTPNRDQLIARLAESNIQTAIHYPIPVHLQQAYRFLGLQRGSFPVAERCADQFLSLPIFPEITNAQISHVINSIHAACQPAVLAK
jgi:dTDP-4-amino-4,6-dideoxygalactose transaminase